MHIFLLFSTLFKLAGIHCFFSFFLFYNRLIPPQPFSSPLFVLFVSVCTLLCFMLSWLYPDTQDEAQCQDWVATRSMRSVFAGGCLALERDLGDKMLWPVVSNLLTAQQTRKPAILTALIGWHQLYTPSLYWILLSWALCLSCYSICAFTSRLLLLSPSLFLSSNTLSKPFVCTVQVWLSTSEESADVSVPTSKSRHRFESDIRETMISDMR